IARRPGRFLDAARLLPRRPVVTGVTALHLVRGGGCTPHEVVRKLKARRLGAQVGDRRRRDRGDELPEAHARARAVQPGRARSGDEAWLMVTESSTWHRVHAATWGGLVDLFGLMLVMGSPIWIGGFVLFAILAPWRDLKRRMLV